MLPSGHSLDEADWRFRHRCSVALVALEFLTIAVVLVVTHHPAATGLAELATVGGFLAVAVAPGRRAVRQVSASLGMMAAAGVFVHLTHGMTEMHFAYFVSLGFVILYQDWLPFFGAVVFVLVEHGVGGIVDPHSVYDHASAIDHPWRWAAIHGGFLLASGATLLASWSIMERGLTRDSLTRLPNRVRLVELLGHPRNRRATLALVDIDDFGRLNDALGYEHGNTLLRAVADRLVASVPAGTVVSRLAANSFAVVFDAGRDPGPAIETLVEGLRAPFGIAGREVHLSASIGVTPVHGAPSAEAAIGQAHAALRAAKDQGKARCQHFTPDLGRDVSTRSQLLADLEGADERGELCLLYQPIVDLETLVLVGTEALMRWDHPTLGRLAPGQFIPLAEQSGLIVPMGRWALRTAIEQLGRWRGEYGDAAPATVAVNTSWRELTRDSFVGDLQRMIEESCIGPENVVIEMTETDVMHDPALALERVVALRDLGVAVALDDFGTGYSSLDQLCRLPMQIVKIDRSFTSRVPHDADGTLVAQTLSNLALALGRTVVIEGIEEHGQEAFFRSIGDFQAQGFLYSPPIEPSVFAADFIVGAGAARARPAPGNAVTNRAGPIDRPAAETTDRGGRIRRVLILEDEAEHVQLLRLYLSSRGIEAVVAASFQEAEAGLATAIDAVFVDLRLGGANGWHFVERLRARAADELLPVVVVSGLSDPATRARAAANRCAHVAKPYRSEDLETGLLQAVLMASGDVARSFAR